MRPGTKVRIRGTEENGVLLGPSFRPREVRVRGDFDGEVFIIETEHLDKIERVR